MNIRQQLKRKFLLPLAITVVGGAGLMLHPLPVHADSAEAKTLYQQGDFVGAFDIWEKLAEAGDPVAQFNLATLYETGRGVDRNPDRVRVLLMQAAGKNYAPALHNLALIQFEEDNTLQAFKYLKQAAEQKFTASLYTLGKFYQFGINGAKKPELAFQYIGEAAEVGHIQAQYNMGKMYRDGFGITRDDAASFRWFLRAAKQGSQKAQAKLVIRYAEGMGVHKDQVSALKWALVTGENNSKKSFALKDELLKNLSSEEIERAVSAAASFRAEKETH